MAKLASEAKQSLLDPHLKAQEVKEQVIPYSDLLFQKAAIEWLIATDQVCLLQTPLIMIDLPLLHIHSHISQPIQALEHPKFQNMIHIAAHATHSVKIPEWRATHRYIMELFKKNMTELWHWLLVHSFTGLLLVIADILYPLAH